MIRCHCDIIIVLGEIMSYAGKSPDGVYTGVVVEKSLALVSLAWLTAHLSTETMNSAVLFTHFSVLSKPS